MADQAKRKGIAPKRASNPANPGQSSRPPPPIRTLSEDKEDGEDYSEVIEFLKQNIKSYDRDSVSAIKNISSTLASLTNSSNTAATGKTSYSPRFDPFSGTMDLDSPLHPPRKEPYLGPAIDNTATSNLDPPIDIGSKEGFKDTITSSIVKELSKTAYTIPDDSKLSGESNFEQWIQALSIVLRALGISNFLENPDISNTYSDSDQAVLLMLLRDSLSSGPRAAISRPIESKKEDVYNEFHALTFSTYKKGLSAFNAEFNGYLAKLTIAKIDIDPSLILNQYFKALESKFPSWASFMLGSYNLAIEEEEKSNSSSNSSSSSDSDTQLAQLLALKGYKKRKDFKGKGLKTSSNNKAKYEDNKPRRRPRDPALYNSWLYDIGSTDHISNSKEQFTTFTPNTGQLCPINTGNGPVSPAGIGSIILEVLSRKAPPTYTKLVLDNVLYLPNIDINIISGVRHYDSGGCLIKETLYGGDRRCIAVLDFKKSGFFLDVKGSSKPILHANFAFPLGLSSYTTKSIEPQRNKIVVEIPSNSIRKEDYRPIIEDAIVSEAIEPNKRYKLRNSPAKGTTLEGVGPSLRGKRPCRPTREPEPLTGTRDLPCVLRELVIEGNKVVEKAISSPTLKEPNIGQRDYYNLLNLAKLWYVRLGHIGLRLLKKTSSITKGLPNFDKIKEADFHCSSCDRGKAVRRVSKALIPDLPRVLDLIEGDTVKIRPRPYNRNPIVLLLVDRRSRYRWVFNLPNKSGPIVANAIKGFFRGLRNGFGRYPTKFHFDGGTEITDLLTTWLAKRGIKFSTSAPYIHEQNGLVERSVRVILDRPTNNTALEGELVDLDLDLEGAVSPDPSNLNTEKPISIEIGPSKLEPYESSSDKPIFAPKPIEVIAPNQPITNEPLDNSDLISEGDKMQLDYYKLLAKTSSYILSFVYKARKRVISKDSTPTTYKQVLKLPRDERSKWLEAITKEFIQLLELGVFKFLPRSLLPSNCKLITCRNVLKVKKDAKNRPIKYKSRIPPTWRILLAIGAVLDWEIEQADFIGAFLNSALREEIYMEIPEGLLDLAASNKAIYKLLLKYGYNPSTPNIIKLSKALYGLKQSPREWQDKLKILLKSLGYLPLISDPGVFYNAKTCHFIVTYVDDCLFIGPNIGYITDLKKRLNKVYAIEDLGPAAYFLGVQIIRDRPNRRRWLNQSQYVEEAVSRFNLADSKPISIPLQPGLVEGLDYTVTYASTSIPPTWRILLAIGAVLDWEIEQADFIGAFLNSALREEIYMEIPEGLLDLAASNKAIYKLLLKYGYNPSTPNIIKLSKALYGLKQSPREWQDKLKILLKSLGYLPLISDPGVFYNAKTCHFIVTYVDDCLFIGPNIGYITDLKKRLNKVYAIEDLGPAAYFLGVQIIRDRPNRRLWLNQSQYVEEAVSRFNLADSKPISIPLQPGLVSQLQLEEDIASHLCNSTEIKLYQSLVGTAMYIMLLTRYLNSTKDYSICFSCNGNTVADLGPKLSNSSNTTTKLSRDFHSKEGPRPLTTTSTTIVDSRNSKGSSRTSIINSSLVPIGFSDSDFAGDKATSKSTYGYLYKLASGPISWKTKRATTIALSTLEAETDGLTEAIREVQWIIGLFSELHRPIDYPITLYGDNQGSITVANDPALHARTKHTLLKFRYVREQVKAKIVTIIYLNTKCF
ncbi:hypothetical protein P8C59_001649 [Phyllachora maydis]|uniref:Integrase catalytic domain-containing protein n=1 Tax=Phyllachora maydis TaxID=1825666 RepID=A0AAD9MAG5_9PEZI|nr:hypothetical protein P8C59_001649 [Phyllachora maydis]